MKEPSFKYDVFLSYASEDKLIIRDLAKRLRIDGIKVWLDEWIIKPGDPISIKIEEGLENSRTLILCMSNSAFKSEWVKLERHTMLFRDPINKGRRFIPLLLDKCELPLLLKQYAYLDWTDKSDIVYKKLLTYLEIRNEKKEFKRDKDYLPKILTGHESWIGDIAISKDGKAVISVGDDKKIKVWNIERRKIIREFNENDTVKSIIYINERNIASGSFDNTVKIWDLETGEKLHTLKGHSNTINTLSITPNEKKLVSGSKDRSIKIWDLKTKENTNTLKGHTGWVLDVQTTPDGKFIISCSIDKTIKIWELDSGKNIATLRGHTRSVIKVSITPDGKIYHFLFN